MPAWTNIHTIILKYLNVGAYILFNETYFEKIDDGVPWITLRCIESNPEAGYGEGVLIKLDASQSIWVDSNRQSAKHDLKKK